MQTIDNLAVTEGVRYLAKGYIDYAKEVISERAIVNLYDGLKPVNRRILYMAKVNKCDTSFRKSARLAGDTLALHPHGDSAIYKASVPMVDRSGYQAFPTLRGSGNFGDISSGRSASAPRYTEEMLHANSKEFFGEMNGIDMIPNFDATMSEPSVLPVSFPNVLVNASEGIAVGFSSKIPSFNFNDVVDLCIEYIENGECTTEIVPDFVTRGYYIKNNKEIRKLMQVGKASLKLRGKVTVQGKNILVTEVPFGKSVASLKKQIEDKDIKNIVSCGDISDYDNGTGLLIECRTKASVDEVLYSLYKDTDLQYNYNANIVVVQDGVPRTFGVHKVIQNWVEWRKKVVTKHLGVELEACKTKMRDCEAFMKLIEMTEVKDEFVRRVSVDGKSKAIEWLREQVKDVIPADEIEFVATRRLDCYHTGGKYAQQYANAKAELELIQSELADIDGTLVNQLNKLKATYGGMHERRTEVTNVDYEFAKEKEEPVKDMSPCVYALNDGFLKKMRYADTTNQYEMQFEGVASDVLVAFDNYGRVLRVYAQDIELCSQYDTGVYLPRLLELGDDKDCRIMWIGRLDGTEKALLYNDGTMGFLDTSEWVGSGRQVRVLKNGISTEASKITWVFDELPEVLAVMDNDGRVGWVKTDTIKHKHRTARTRVWTLKKDNILTAIWGGSYVELLTLLNNSSNYEAPKLKFLESEDDYLGDGSEFIAM